jgi:hypothetical protein
LNNLVYVGGELLISYNTGLISFQGLENLESDLPVLDIINNSSLLSLQGLEKIESVSGPCKSLIMKA